MNKVQFFEADNGEGLAQNINDFLAQNPTIRIIDIKYQCCFQFNEEEELQNYSALLFFDF